MVRFLEVDAPVQGAVATSPTNPDTSGTDHHLSAVGRVFGLDGDAEKAGVEDTVQMLVKVPYYKDWGFIVNGPAPAQVTKEQNGNYKVKYLFSLMPQTAFFRPPKQGQTKPAEFFDVPVEDKEVTMSAKEYQATTAQALQMMPPGGMPQGPGGPGGAMGGGPMGGMGGGPMGGL